MKLLVGTIILGTAASAFAQEAARTTPVAPVTPVAPRVAVLPAIASDISIVGTTKNVPFTANESGETVRIAQDGTRSVDNWTGTVMRNSEGRIRREINTGNATDGVSRPVIISSGGIAGPGIVTVNGGDENMVRIARIDAENAARTTVLGTGSALTVTSVNGDALTPELREKIEAAKAAGKSIVLSGNNDAARAELLARVEETRATAGGTWVASTIAPLAKIDAELAAAAIPARLPEGKFQSRKEDLGTRDFGGFQATGTRTITTIAAGTAGFDRDVEIVSESWFSKDLGVIVYSKRSDSRGTETTYQMTNIVRAEPDPSLFPGRR